MPLSDAFTAFVTLGLLLIAARYLRHLFPRLRHLLLPGSVIAGFLGLALGPEVAGRVATWTGSDSGFLANGLLPEAVYDAWSELPGLLITVVFAGLLLGKPLHRPRTVWNRSAPMIAHGLTLTFGLYVIGIALALALLSPLFDLNPASGALLEIGFQGGHGTAAGLGGTFEEFDFAQGEDLAMGLATVGILAGVFIGTAIVHWGRRRNLPGGRSGGRDSPSPAAEAAASGGPSQTSAAGADIVDRLSIQLGFLALAIAVGWLVLEGLKLAEQVLWAGDDGLELFAHVPLFPFAMLGSVATQLSLRRLGREELLDPDMIDRASGAALDALIVAAIATLALGVIGANIWVFLILAAAGLAWNLFGFFYLAPRMLGRFWLEKGLANFGQGVGMTVIGLLLIQVTDKQDRTGTRQAFAYKQLLYEPFVGGGIVTAAAIPLIAQLGPWPMLAASSALTAGWLYFGLRLGRRAERPSGNAAPVLREAQNDHHRDSHAPAPRQRQVGARSDQYRKDPSRRRTNAGA